MRRVEATNWHTERVRFAGSAPGPYWCWISDEFDLSSTAGRGAASWALWSRVSCGQAVAVATVDWAEGFGVQGREGDGLRVHGLVSGAVGLLRMHISPGLVGYCQQHPDERTPGCDQHLFFEGASRSWPAQLLGLIVGQSPRQLTLAFADEERGQ